MGDVVASSGTVEGIERLKEILRDIHPQAAEIITAQVAIENEIYEIFRKQFVNPEFVPRKLKTIHIVALLKASTTEKWAIRALDAASAFTDLRNSVAHGDNGSEIGKNITKLLDAMEQIGLRPNPVTVRYGSVALVIIAALHECFQGTK